MKAKSYKLKYIPSEEELTAAGFREGGSWINKKSKLFKSRYFDFPSTNYEFSVSICSIEDMGDWNDWDNVVVLDEEFGQPYTPFYGKNYQQEITDFPALEYCIEKYNEFMDSFDFLEEVDE